MKFENDCIRHVLSFDCTIKIEHFQITENTTSDAFRKVNASIIKNYFDPSAFKFLQNMITKKRKMELLCNKCSSDIKQFKSVACASCLLYFHKKCVKATNVSVNYFCPQCKETTN